MVIFSDKGSQYEKGGALLAETQLMGYEQGELLSCIDNGQLPAMLAEQLEPNNSHLFYDGCIIAEVRDYRKSFPHNKADVHHVLLKPTTQVTQIFPHNLSFLEFFLSGKRYSDPIESRPFRVQSSEKPFNFHNRFSM